MSSTAQQKPETRGGEDAVRFHCRAFSGGGGSSTQTPREVLGNRWWVVIKPSHLFWLSSSWEGREENASFDPRRLCGLVPLQPPPPSTAGIAAQVLATRQTLPGHLCRVLGWQEGRFSLRVYVEKQKLGNRYCNKETPPGRGEDRGEGPGSAVAAGPTCPLTAALRHTHTVPSRRSSRFVRMHLTAPICLSAQERCLERSGAWGQSPGSLTRLVCQLCVYLWLGHLTFPTEEVAEKVKWHIWFLKKGLVLRK